MCNFAVTHQGTVPGPLLVPSRTNISLTLLTSFDPPPAPCAVQSMEQTVVTVTTLCRANCCCCDRSVTLCTANLAQTCKTVNKACSQSSHSHLAGRHVYTLQCSSTAQVAVAVLQEANSHSSTRYSEPSYSVTRSCITT